MQFRMPNLPGSVKRTGDRCANQAPSEHGGKTQAAHCCPQEGWRTGMTEDVAAQAGCQGEQTVIGIPGHLLSGTHEIGCTDVTEHDIELVDHKPFKERFCRITPPLVEELRQHIQEMLDGGAIRPSQSPCCNAVVLVRKKDGSLRFCIDFRHLNAKTKKDSYPLPQMQETMESMVCAQYFSCMDLKSGFWQVKMSEKAHQYTAFTVGSIGVYEFLCMPYGLCNAPATFQRLMQNCLGELNLTYTLIYLDNIIVYSRTEEEHLTRLRAMFERFRESGLKLKPSKCNFFCTEINYLGHTVSAKGMEPSMDGIKAIVEMALPRTCTGICLFLGGYRLFPSIHQKIRQQRQAT